MARELRAHETVGKWTLTECIGRGGNAMVWRAHDSDGLGTALKVLKTSNRASDPFKRFTHEIEILTQLKGREGVIPILEFYVPKEGIRENRAWYAMPLAQPIQDTIFDEDRLISAVIIAARVAMTLTDLALEEIYHRDIKPDNILNLEGSVVISDFGLADFPEKPNLTEGALEFGPRNFMPPEMFEDAERASPGPADVYMLAKTMWVLAQQKTYPPGGELRADVSSLRISTGHNHPRAVLLDTIIERATRHEPQSRPTMLSFRDDLQSWLVLGDEETTPVVISRLGALVESMFTDERSKEQELQRVRAEFNRWEQEFKEFLKAIGEQLRQSNHLQTSSGNSNVTERAIEMSDFANEGAIHGASDNLMIESRHHIGDPLWIAYRLWFSTTGNFQVAVALFIAAKPAPGPNRNRTQGKFDLLWRFSQKVPILSPQADRAVREAKEGLVSQLELKISHWKESLSKHG